MGSCVSSNSKKPKPESKPTPASSPKDQSLQNRALVPDSDTPVLKPNDTKQYQPSLTPALLHPVLDEETVKEVLSETPAIPKRVSSHHQHHHLQQLEQEKQPKILRLPSFPRIEEEKKKAVSFVEEMSEVSEICSISETSVTNSGLSRDNYEVRHQQQQRFERSPSKVARKRSTSGDFTYRAVTSPARRRETVPTVKSVSCREMSKSPATKRVLVRNGSLARDAGETSGRRSRSPAKRNEVTNNNGVYRSPSARRIMGSLGKIPMITPEKRWMGGEEKWQTKESLEDPLVSLECFIFL